MSDQMDYLGETKFFDGSSGILKTWHVWGYYDEDGKLSAIRYGISTNLLCALPDLLFKDCTTPLQKHLWAEAQKCLNQNLIYDVDDDDFEVIEPFDAKVAGLNGELR